jgi:hypothetical protein
MLAGRGDQVSEEVQEGRSRLGSVVSVRFTEDELGVLRARAAAVGATVSALIRRAALERFVPSTVLTVASANISASGGGVMGEYRPTEGATVTGLSWRHGQSEAVYKAPPGV